MTGPLVIARRSFLRGLNLAVGGLTLGFSFSARAQKAPVPSGSQALDATAPGLNPNVFLHVAPDGLVTIVCHRSEMGQGIRSSLPVLIADELGAQMARVKIRQADGDVVYGDQNTDGSNSIRGFYEDLRRVGATARMMLIEAAAARWKVRADECVAKDHLVTHRPTKRRLGFGALAVEAARRKIPEPKTVVLRPRSELTSLTANMPLLDGPAYVTGQAMFGADVRLPGMLTVVIARPPVVGGTIVRFDAADALAVPGVVKVVEMPQPKVPWHFQPWGGLAVVAENTWAAMRGRAALHITWAAGPNGAYDSEVFKAALSKAVSVPGLVARKVGDAEAALKSAARTVEAEYHVPHLPHLPMEPPVAVARMTSDLCEVWAPTQNPQAAQKEVARALGVPLEKVRVHVTFLGGAFGRKAKADFCSEAAVLAKMLGVPVRMQFTREDDLRHDYVNTVSTNRLTAGLDPSGRVVALRYRTAFPSIQSLFGDPATPEPEDLQQGVLDLAFAVPNLTAEIGVATAHTRIGWLRSVYNIFQGFSIGSFVDELAHERKADPRDVWLELIGPPRKLSLSDLGVKELKNYGQPLELHPVDAGRLRNVIDRVTRAARWDERGRDGRFLGLAAHRSFLSYVAAIVSMIKRPDGKLVVDEVWVALDAGIIVNAERVRAQMEGSVIFGMSLALYGGITMKNGAIEQENFRDGGRIVRMGEAPRKTWVDLMESDAAPGGVGEPGVPPIAPAIANAVFALTGQRVRELPLIKAMGRQRV
ncbi:MAG: molybdopterin-dependent oxidoreductase [Archangium sp.]|nr:molybdopterin-dependent oxidoreductase [Archangium sp.]MDP3156727.1 molybdopterin-dependent oxidoreductase [Archangium sp.]MDP3574655.1 molybdopterin-dependent oxidoreductase [Archangium sp.]